MSSSSSIYSIHIYSIHLHGTKISVVFSHIYIYISSATHRDLSMCCVYSKSNHSIVSERLQCNGIIRVSTSYLSSMSA